MNRVLAFAAIAEVATGVALIAAPGLVGRLLLGADFSGGVGGGGVAVVMARILGIALFSLGLACWPGKTSLGGSGGRPALAGMIAYGALTTLYLGFLGVRGEWVGVGGGPLLWPAAALHAILTLLLARCWKNVTPPAIEPSQR